MTQQKLLQEVFLLVSKRTDNVCNFLDGDRLSGSWGEDTKLIYRNYATLYFIFACESTESELGILDLIQGLLPLPFSFCVVSAKVFSMILMT